MTEHPLFKADYYELFDQNVAKNTFLLYVSNFALKIFRIIQVAYVGMFLSLLQPLRNWIWDVLFALDSAPKSSYDLQKQNISFLLSLKVKQFRIKQIFYLRFVLVDYRTQKSFLLGGPTTHRNNLEVSILSTIMTVCTCW